MAQELSNQFAPIRSTLFGASIYPASIYPLNAPQMRDPAIAKAFPSGVVYSGERKALRDVVSMDVWTSPNYPIQDSEIAILATAPEHYFDSYIQSADRKAKTEVINELSIECLKQPYLLIHLFEYMDQITKQRDPATKHVIVENFLNDTLAGLKVAAQINEPILRVDSDRFTIWFDYLAENVKVFDEYNSKITKRTRVTDKPAAFNVSEGLGQIIHGVYDGTISHGPSLTENLSKEDLKYASQKDNISAVVDFSYTLLSAGLRTGKTPGASYAQRIISEWFYSRIDEGEVLQKSLFILGAYSDNDETRRKSILSELILHRMAHTFGLTAEYDAYVRSIPNNKIAKHIIIEMESLFPSRLNILDEFQLGKRMEQLFVQYSEDLNFYLPPQITEIERSILTHDYEVLIAFSNFINHARPEGYQETIAVILPDGVFRHIATGGKNDEIATTVLQRFWQNDTEPQIVTHKMAIEDVLIILNPSVDSRTDGGRITASVVDPSIDSALFSNGFIPVSVNLGTKQVSLMIGQDGAIYMPNGDSLVIHQEKHEAWFKHFMNQVRGPLFNHIFHNQIVISEKNAGLILKALKPDLLGVSFTGLESDLKRVKNELAHPKRGILENGITVKIKPGQLPNEIPIESIRYNQAGSEAVVKLGETKLKIGINMTQPPPSITTIEGVAIPDGQEKTWLEYVILSPLKAITCPDPKKIAQGCEDSVLLTDLTDGQEARIKRTIEMLHKNVGHLYPLVGTKNDGSPYQPSPKQIAKVKLLRYPLPGMEELDLVEYNSHPENLGEHGEYMDFAVYNNDKVVRHQEPKEAEVSTPHAFDTLASILLGEKKK